MAKKKQKNPAKKGQAKKIKKADKKILKPTATKSEKKKGPTQRLMDNLDKEMGFNMNEELNLDAGHINIDEEADTSQL